MDTKTLIFFICNFSSNAYMCVYSQLEILFSIFLPDTFLGPSLWQKLSPEEKVHNVDQKAVKELSGFVLSSV